MKNTSKTPPKSQENLMDLLQFEEWLTLTDAIKDKFGLDAYHAADLAIKYITVRTLQNGLLKGFADEALLSAIETAILDLNQECKISSDQSKFETD
jgi:hypothetical protein